MIQPLRGLTGLFALVLVTACSAAPARVAAPAPAQQVEEVEEPSAEPSTADGIFTVAQAERGHELFRTVCSECHDQEDWTEVGFRNRWEDQSVFQLWYYINDRMPYDDPWSLSRQQVTDVLTYILQLNDLPAGASELATDDDSIDDYWIVWRTK
ncbi:MAG: cytochrome c [Gemmatimonadota bacterium]|nr:cytochrome c [Gemmatimonadota bacterium]MDH3423859.1 cytochrome c [Gemmatimonadota bacterium]